MANKFSRRELLKGAVNLGTVLVVGDGLGDLQKVFASPVGQAATDPWETLQNEGLSYEILDSGVLYIRYVNTGPGVRVLDINLTNGRFLYDLETLYTDNGPEASIHVVGNLPSLLTDTLWKTVFVELDGFANCNITFGKIGQGGLKSGSYFIQTSSEYYKRKITITDFPEDSLLELLHAEYSPDATLQLAISPEALSGLEIDPIGLLYKDGDLRFKLNKVNLTEISLVDERGFPLNSAGKFVYTVEQQLIFDSNEKPFASAPQAIQVFAGMAEEAIANTQDVKTGSSRVDGWAL